MDDKDTQLKTRVAFQLLFYLEMITNFHLLLVQEQQITFLHR